jgi:hypothetical protein
MDRTPPYEYLAGTIHPINPEPGGEMSVERTVRINRMCPGAQQREIVFQDGSIINYDAQPALIRDQLSGNPLITTAVLMPLLGLSGGRRRHRVNVPGPT